MPEDKLSSKKHMQMIPGVSMELVTLLLLPLMGFSMQNGPGLKPREDIDNFKDSYYRDARLRIMKACCGSTDRASLQLSGFEHKVVRWLSKRNSVASDRYFLTDTKCLDLMDILRSVPQGHHEFDFPIKAKLPFLELV